MKKMPLKERWRIAITPVSEQLDTKKSQKLSESAVNSPMTVEEIPLNLAEDEDTQNLA